MPGNYKVVRYRYIPTVDDLEQFFGHFEDVDSYIVCLDSKLKSYCFYPYPCVGEQKIMFEIAGANRESGILGYLNFIVAQLNGKTDQEPECLCESPACHNADCLWLAWNNSRKPKRYRYL